MNVLFTARASLFAQPGGDTQQVVQAAEHLRTIGVTVDILLHGEVRDFNGYDIIHFFNSGRPADIYADLKSCKKPLVVSSIWVDYTEWDKKQSGIRGMVARNFGAFASEYSKTIARAFNGTDKFPGWRYVLAGQKNAMSELLKRAQVVVATSASEVNRLSSAFGIEKKCRVVPLGLSNLLKLENSEVRNGVVCVGRIEGLKNQHNLIKAAEGASWQLTIIGKAALNQPEYAHHCQQLAGKNVVFTGWLEPEHVNQAYKAAKVLVLPSYFETFGLVALEALANGCNLVLANRPDMNSIFAGNALFCNPDDPVDIRAKIEQALELPEAALTATETEKYSWSKHAEELKAIYTELLSAPRQA